MKTKDLWGKSTFVISTDFSFFLRCKILNTSFLLESLMITFFGLAFDFKRLDASIFAGSTGVSHSFKIFKTQSKIRRFCLFSKAADKNFWLSEIFFVFSNIKLVNTFNTLSAVASCGPIWKIISSRCWCNKSPRFYFTSFFLPSGTGWILIFFCFFLTTCFLQYR